MGVLINFMSVNIHSWILDTGKYIMETTGLRIEFCVEGGQQKTVGYGCQVGRNGPTTHTGTARVGPG